MGHLGLAVIDDGPRQVRRLHLPLNLSFPRPKSLLDLEDNERTESAAAKAAAAAPKHLALPQLLVLQEL